MILISVLGPAQHTRSWTSVEVDIISLPRSDYSATFVSLLDHAPSCYDTNQQNLQL